MSRKLKDLRTPPYPWMRCLLLVYGLALMAIIILAGLAGDSQSGSKVGALVGQIPAGDKVGHFLLFGTLAYLVHRSFLRRDQSVLRWVCLTLAVAALVVAEEFTQLWLPNRNFDLGDIVADLLGILIFSAFAYFGMRRKMSA